MTKIVGFQSGHDISYCILEDGLPVLCEELERINRKKTNLGDGLKFFFERYSDLDSINYFTFGNWGNRKGRAAKHCKDEESEAKMQAVLKKNNAQFYEFGHHLAHAANAFYTSDFDEALIITMDGGGNEDDRTRTAFTINKGYGNKIERLKIFPIRELDIGAIWHFGTRDVFGLPFWSAKGDQCGTVMAMATLGEPKYEYLYDDYSNNVQKLRDIVETSEQEKFNVAASLQKYTEKVVKKTISEYINGYENVCLSGGVALNCVMAPKIKTWFPQVKNIFCDPVPYDAGTALGSARYLWHQILGNPRIKNNPKNMSPYLGKSYTEKDINEACATLADKIKVTKVNDEDVLDKLEKLKIISVYGGHSETGRRALGNRSILADPRNSGMKAQINTKVKHRQWFRPVAPAILEEKVPEWFENPMPSPYMSFALNFIEEKQDLVPGVVHYDGTGRLQSVSKSLNPWFHGFLTKWEKRTGTPILINTSFNDSEPIVETPTDALNCFLKTELDYLYFFDYGLLVEKKSSEVTKVVGFQSGHDVSYCIFEDGIPTLVEEWERISRKKMEDGDGLKFFFERQKDTSDIKYFTLGNWKVRRGRLKPVSADPGSEEKMNKVLAENGGQFYEFSHHLCHAANAFYTSDFDKALIITMDAGGWEDERRITCFTIREGMDNKINTVKVFTKQEANLGTIWWEMTKHVFGLSVGYPKGDQAGTVMAMATLGKPKYVNLLTNYQSNIQELKRIVNISEKEKFNVAASLQEYTETNFQKIVSEYIGNHENLCVSGGVSLNCVLLGKIRTWFPQIKNIFADPIPYDAGLALGSARYLWHCVLGNPRVKGNIKNLSPYLGKIYSEQEVRQACKLFESKTKLTKATDEEVVDKIIEQKIVAVFGGGAEHGRRALGNRSILADPRNPAMKALINEKVKHRQWFRPLAPAILEEKIGDWFLDPIPSPYMSFALKYKSDKQNQVPAVVHYDGTGRLQTVNKDLSPWFHEFISKWEAKSGVPIIINTSFNDSEPIVETPEDAFNCFLGTDLDYLYFFDYGILVTKI